MGNITVRLAAGITDSLGCATEPAASSRVTMPRLALNRKDLGETDRRAAPVRHREQPPAFNVGRLTTLVLWPYRGRLRQSLKTPDHIGSEPGTTHAIVVTSPDSSGRRPPPAEPR